jgi:hypothetical protein
LATIEALTAVSGDTTGGHAPETNSLHQEELNDERRRAAFVIGTEPWFGLLLNATALVLHDWFE